MEKYCSNCDSPLNNNNLLCVGCELNIKNDNIMCNEYQDKGHFILQKNKEARKLAIRSFVFAIIPILLYLFCVIVSNGEDESGAGAIGWLLIFYYMSFGIPFALISLVYGIRSLIVKINLFAILSILIDSIPFLIFIR